MRKLHSLLVCLVLVSFHVASAQFHSADYGDDRRINLSELLRLVQFYNAETIHCDALTEDGFAIGAGDTTCPPHDSDYLPRDWQLQLTELLRLIQFYNIGGYGMVPGTEDGFEVDATPDEGEGEGGGEGSPEAEGEGSPEAEGEGGFIGDGEGEGEICFKHVYLYDKCEGEVDFEGVAEGESEGMWEGSCKTVYIHVKGGCEEPIEGEEGEAEPQETPFENPFILTAEEQLSTFGVDVDTASYTIVRRDLMAGQKPPRQEVRVEEMINYFPYDYAPPESGSDEPLAVHTELAAAPWNPENRLLRIGFKALDFDNEQRPAANLVFLLDISGSMAGSNKLSLVKEAIALLVYERLRPNDRVTIVTYSTDVQLALEPTLCDEAGKLSILALIATLEANGSTNGAGGIQMAYEQAEEYYIQGGSNRIILCTDGDFNVGVSDPEALADLVESYADTGVFLTVLGFGIYDIGGTIMETLANHGNGNYAYIDRLGEAHKALVRELTSNVVTVAKDVKVQVAFDPDEVKAYRLIGYENRLLGNGEFEDDERDSGEIGAGHTVTALYELRMQPSPQEGEGVPEGEKAEEAEETDGFEAESEAEGEGDGEGEGEVQHFPGILELRVRFKQPDQEVSQLLTYQVHDNANSFDGASQEYRFQAAVAAFGMLLRLSAYSGSATFALVEQWAEAALGADDFGYRSDFLTLVQQAASLY